MVYIGSYQDQESKNVIDSIEVYVKSLDLSSDKTFHNYESQLPNTIKHRMHTIKYGALFCSLFQSTIDKNDYEHPTKYLVDSIDEMNEVYIASMGAKGSDQVFETNHIDGPFFFLPFCTVFRAVVGVSSNNYVYTRFPYIKISEEKEIRINKYDFAAFDYNRDIHSVYMKHPEEYNEAEKRIVLKLHYIKYWKYIPRPIVSIYKYAHIWYNSMMRNMFLFSQFPRNSQLKWNNCIQWSTACAINYGTVMYCNFISRLYR